MIIDIIMEPFHSSNFGGSNQPCFLVKEQRWAFFGGGRTGVMKYGMMNYKPKQCTILRENPQNEHTCASTLISLAGGFNPIERYSSNWISSPSRGKNKTSFQPPPLTVAPQYGPHLMPAHIPRSFPTWCPPQWPLVQPSSALETTSTSGLVDMYLYYIILYYIIYIILYYIILYIYINIITCHILYIHIITWDPWDPTWDPWDPCIFTY